LSEERIDRHIYQYVEAELRNYKTYQKLIAEYQKEYAGVKSSMGNDITGRFSQGATSDSVYNEVNRVINCDVRIVRAIHMVMCIEDILFDLSDQDRQLIEIKYFQGWLTDWGVSRELHMSRKTYYKHRNRIINKFALRMRLL
jgi:RinA family phage transcriptional activator